MNFSTDADLCCGLPCAWLAQHGEGIDLRGGIADKMAVILETPRAPVMTLE
jgi:hypothetical protein